MEFENWYASTLGKPVDDIRALLKDRSALQFLICWSLFESRCFEGFLRVGDIGRYCERMEWKKVEAALESHFVSMHARYQDQERRRHLHHNAIQTQFEEIASLRAELVSGERKLFFLIYIVYRFRNNMFHGNKGVHAWLGYRQQINMCTEIMQLLIALEERRERRLCVEGPEQFELRPNYAFKPTAEQAIGIDSGSSSRGGLTRR